MIAPSLLLRVLTCLLLCLTMLPGIATVGGAQKCDQAQQRQLFVQVESKEGRRVEGLQLEDLAVSINKSAAEILRLENRADQSLSVVILIDRSISQTGVLEGIKVAARRFIRSNLRKDKDLAGLVSFTGEATIEQDLTQDLAKLLVAIQGVKPGLHRDELGGVLMGRTPPSRVEVLEGAAAIWDAVWATTDGVLKFATHSRRIILLLTHGEDTISKTKLREAIENAGSHDIAVFSLGIAHEKYFPLHKDSLKRLSQETGGRAFFPKKLEELDAIFLEIAQRVRSQYLLTYCLPTQGPKNTPQKVQIEIRNPRLRKADSRLSYSHYVL